MIDENVTALAGTFLNFWAKVFDRSPRYMLDVSWPSIGVLELILGPIRTKKELTPNDENLINGAAAYLAALADEIWNRFGEEVTSTAQLGGEADRQVVLRAVSPDKKELCKIEITAELRKALTSAEPTLRLFEEHTFDRKSAALVPVFALGVCSGMFPPGTGRWVALKASEAKSHVIGTEMMLAKSSAKYYSRIFPSEPIGANPELYCHGLILPPAGYRESFPGSRAAFALVEQLKLLAAPEESYLTIALNLAQFPDPQIAEAGFSVAAALAAKEAPSERCLEISEGMGPRKIALQGPIAMARKNLGLPESPAAALESRGPEETSEILARDFSLGLCPLFRISLAEALVIPGLLNKLYWTFAAESRELIDQHAAANPLPGSLILQGIFLDLYLGNPARAKTELLDPKNNRPLAEVDSPGLRSLRDEVVAALALHEGNIALADEMFTRAAQHPGLDRSLQAQLRTMQAECVLLKGENEKALFLFESAIEIFPNLQARLRALRLQKFLSPDADLEPEIEKLSRSAPRDQEVFQLLLQLRLGQTLV